MQRVVNSKANDQERYRRLMVRPQSADAKVVACRQPCNDYVSHYAGQRLSNFNLSGALDEVTEIIRRYKIMPPARAAMLL